MYKTRIDLWEAIKTLKQEVDTLTTALRLSEELRKAEAGRNARHAAHEVVCSVNAILGDMIQVGDDVKPEDTPIPF